MDEMKLQRGARSSSVAADRLRNRAATMSVVTAVGLVTLKLAASAATGSLSLLASAVDSLMDIFASVINFVAIRTALQPADEDHEYGHGKAEGLAGLFQGAVIGISGLYVGYESVRRFFVPQAIEAEAVGIAVMVVSTGASFALVRYLRHAARETESIALAADSVHFATDVVTNLGVLVTLVAVRATGVDVLDPAVSLAISVYILVSAYGVLRESIDHLMDRALPEEIHEKVREIALAHPQILGIHDLRTRAVGPRRFIEIHLEIEGTKTLHEAHASAVEVLRAIEAAIPNSKVFVHTDPV